MIEKQKYKRNLFFVIDNEEVMTEIAAASKKMVIQFAQLLHDRAAQ